MTGWLRHYLDLIRRRDQGRLRAGTRVSTSVPTRSIPREPAVTGRLARAAADRRIVRLGTRRRAPAARRPRSAVPGLHVRRVRSRPVQPVRACGGDGGRRGAAVEGVQPVVHLRRCRTRQDPPARRDRTSHAPAQPAAAREVRDERELHDRVHQGGARAAGLPVRRSATATSTCCSSTTSSSSPSARRRRRSSSTRSTRCTRGTTDRHRVRPSAAGASAWRSVYESRFRLGLCVDVQPPDLETRIAILQLKAQREAMLVPDDVIEFIASQVRPERPRARGCAGPRRGVVRPHRSADRRSSSPSRRSRTSCPQTETEIPPQLILEETANYFGLSIERPRVARTARGRSTTARHIAMYLMRECTRPVPGQDRRDLRRSRPHHRAVTASIKVEKKMRARDTTYRQVQDLSRIIRGRARGQRENRWTTTVDTRGNRSGMRDCRGRGEHRHRSPPPVHMSEGATTLGNGVVLPLLHSPYYYWYEKEPYQKHGPEGVDK